ncbi:MAG: CpaF family protein [Myxococcales bacterium]|nr:CpaF family protein [Myxococcales bacterium]
MSPKAYPIDPKIAAAGGQAILGALLADEQLEEIMHNGSGKPLMVFHRTHGMCMAQAHLDDAYVSAFAAQVAERNGASLSPETPMMDGTLDDGSRVHLAMPPASPAGLSFTIRKFLRSQITPPQLVAGGTLSPEVGAFLWMAIDGLGRNPANMLIVGGTASGKTTLLSALTLLIPESQRIVLIEDTAEVRLHHPNTVRTLASPASPMDTLLKGALRMRPDRIVVGEVRGPEAQTLFTAMNTGHQGTLGTLHATTARETILRITHEPMAVPLAQTSALDLVVVTETRQEAGSVKRIVTEVAEVSGYGDGVARMNTLYQWDNRRGATLRTAVPSRWISTTCRALGIDHGTFQAAQAKRRALLADGGRARLDAPSFMDSVRSV